MVADFIELTNTRLQILFGVLVDMVNGCEKQLLPIQDTLELINSSC